MERHYLFIIMSKLINFTIVVTGYNCKDCVKPLVDSILAQSYRNFNVVLVDDGSTDGTDDEILRFGRKHNNFTIVELPKNKGTFYAREEGIFDRLNHEPYSDQDEVIVMVDMDDQLKPRALYQLAQQYLAGKWMTYGNYEFLNGLPCPVDLNYADEIHATRDYRKDKTWRCTHLRSFYRKLYELIPKWELTPAEVNSYPDVHTLFSMMEMCGKDRIGVIEKPIYIYNTANPLSTLKRFGKDHAGYAEIINRPKMDQIFEL